MSGARRQRTVSQVLRQLRTAIFGFIDTSRIAPALCDEIFQQYVKHVKKQRGLRGGCDHHLEESSIFLCPLFIYSFILIHRTA